jgi:hypothetical protein
MIQYVSHGERLGFILSGQTRFITSQFPHKEQGPVIRAKISRGLNKSRMIRINSQFAISRGLFRPSFQLWAYFSRGLLQIDCLYESFATYLSRGLFRPRLIFARINGPIIFYL